MKKMHDRKVGIVEKIVKMKNRVEEEQKKASYSNGVGGWSASWS